MSDTNTILRLDKLTLCNFRCFSAAELLPHKELTVLVAENARGKTASLDAIATALKLFVDTIADTKQYYHNFDKSDVRRVPDDNGVMQPQLPTGFTAAGLISNNSIEWSREVLGCTKHSRTTTKTAKKLVAAAKSCRALSSGSNQEEQRILPIIAFYGTGRLWSDQRLSEEKKTTILNSDNRMAGYLDCLSSTSSFKGLVTWYEKTMCEIRDPRYSTVLGKNISFIAAIDRATAIVMEPVGWTKLDWENGLSVIHPENGRLPLSSMSDGIQIMIALVADIARRCVVLNPHLAADAAEQTPGIVLIDEIDMHLHPRWQQLVVSLLRKAFPKVQFIMSTHSPHVLSTVDKDSIRVIRIEEGKGFFDKPTYQTLGVESADVLAKIMKVDPVPQVKEAHWLSTYRAALQSGQHQSPVNQELWERLCNHFGPEHPLINDLVVMQDFHAFKVAHGITTSAEVPNAYA